MRQLGTIAFLLILVAFGTYLLVVQQVRLDLFYPPTSFQFPQEGVPAPLQSITPGPIFHSEFSEGPAPAASAPALVSRAPFRASNAVPKFTPLPIVAPTVPAVTPLPAPTYSEVTPPPLDQTPAAIVAPDLTVHVFAQPSPTPRVRPEDLLASPRPHDESVSPSPRATTPDQGQSPAPSPSPT
jgi:hypothetical protein